MTEHARTSTLSMQVHTAGGLNRPKHFTHGQHGLYLGLISRLPDQAWRQYLPWACPKGRVSGAYRLRVCVCRVNHSKLQATSTDLHRGSRELQGWIRYGRRSTMCTEPRALPGNAALSLSQTDLESRSESLSTALQVAGHANEVSPEARRHGSGHIDTGSRWTPSLSV